MVKKEVLLCTGTGCLSAGAEQIWDKLTEELAKFKLSDRYSTRRVVKKTGCLGPCSLGPMMVINPDGNLYVKLKVADVERIVSEDFIGGNPVKELMVEGDRPKITALSDLNFIKNQQKIVLNRMGKIDPERIEDYLEADGYQAVKKVLTEMTPAQVIAALKASGLRGRGGAGFPTGRKWELAKRAVGELKYIVCNADEGDPGAFMDRTILEGDPHSIIEAMVIAGYSIGAKQGYIYVRAEYPQAIKHMRTAIRQAEDNNYLGPALFGTNFGFKLEIRVGAGAFVCGEETALLASIEGERGQPRPKPPYPVTSGLWGRPTVINNVETLANIPSIILKGSKWFSSIGTEKSKGTKVFAIAGDVCYTGLIEVPMGVTLREIIYELAGGIPAGKKFKAAQIGGPSGGTIPEQYLDMAIDYESLQEIGAIIGSGGLIIIDQDKCMVDVARFFLEFTQDESCGKCVPCRIGTRRMLEILERIVSGAGQEGDLEKLEALSRTIKETSLCGLGQTAPNPVLSTIKFFRDEYEAHISEKRCPSNQCQHLRTAYQIKEEDCRGCARCVKVCPAEAISGQLREAHYIDQSKCIVCGACIEVCPVQAIS